MILKRFVKVTRLCLFLSLLNATTPVFAQGIEAPDVDYGPDDVELDYGRPAPFDGVLTTKLKYAEYTTALDQNEYLSRRLQQEIEKPVTVKSDFQRDALIYLMGIVTGGLGLYFISH